MLDRLAIGPNDDSKELLNQSRGYSSPDRKLERRPTVEIWAQSGRELSPYCRTHNKVTDVVTKSGKVR